MKLPFCPHEEKIAKLLNENRWPWDSDPALVVHAAKCDRCREAMFAVQMLQQGRAPSMMSAHSGSPGYLWWRAQLRRQSGAVEHITKPVVWAERFALVGVLCIAASFAFWQWGQIRDWFSPLAAVLGPQTFRLNAMWFSATNESNLIALSMVAGLAAIACIGGLALFMSHGKE